MAKNSQVFRRLVQLVLDSASVTRTKKALQDALNQGTDAKGLKKNLRAVDASIAALKKTAISLGAAFLAVFSIGKLREYADGWKALSSRLKLVTADSDALRRVQGKLFDIAQKTFTSFRSTVDLFAKVSAGAEELGRSEAELLDLVETINKAIAVGGSSAQAADAALVQLSQGIASGVLRGEELNSVLEQTPGLARALADGLGVGVGQLRAMGAAGELTADRVIGALLRVRESVDRDFKRGVAVTISGATTVLTNELMRFVGMRDEVTGTSSAIVSAILGISDAVPVAGKALDNFLFNIQAMGAGAAVQLQQLQVAWLRFWEGLGRFGRRVLFGQDLEVRDGELRLPEVVDSKKLRDAEALLQRMKEAAAEIEASLGKPPASTGAPSVPRPKNAAEAADQARQGQLEAERKVREELLRVANEQLDTLIEAHTLGVQTTGETKTLRVIHASLTAELERGNVALERRIELTRRVADIERAAPSLAPRSLDRTAPTQMGAVLAEGPPDLLADRRDDEGGLVIHAPDITSATDGAAEVEDAWVTAFQTIGIEAQIASGLMQATFDSAGFMAGLAQVASAKAKENIARAVEVVAGGLAQFVFGDPTKLGPAAKAAAGFTAAAGLWAALGAAGGAGGGGGGGGGGGSAALAGGSRPADDRRRHETFVFPFGYPSFDLPFGRETAFGREAPGRMADRVKPPDRVTNIHLRVDGIDPNNAVHQYLAGTAARKFMDERRGHRITDRRKD